LDTKAQTIDPMKPIDPIVRSFSFLIPISLIAILAVRCSSNDTTSGNDHDASMDRTDNAVEVDVDADGRGTSVAVDVNDDLYYARPSDTMTPAEERSWATADMRRLRAALIADLEEVRARLNVGSTPEPQHDKDQALAADLAQGLERIDRALVALDASTDATWGSVREGQLKEVDDVRTWMRGYRKDHVMVKK
jgi:hypothetical protein